MGEVTSKPTARFSGHCPRSQKRDHDLRHWEYYCHNLPSQENISRAHNFGKTKTAMPCACNKTLVMRRSHLTDVAARTDFTAWMGMGLFVPKDGARHPVNQNATCRCITLTHCFIQQKPQSQPGLIAPGSRPNSPLQMQTQLCLRSVQTQL
jgi:hypothetical protein